MSCPFKALTKTKMDAYEVVAILQRGGSVRLLNIPLSILEKINSVIMRIFEQIAWVLVAFMVLTILIQVFFRYALNAALPWPEEAARAFMIWMMALVAAQAYRNNAFVAIEMLHDYLPKLFAKTLKLILLIVAGAVLFKLVQLGLKYFDRGFRTKAAAINYLVVSYYVEMALCVAAFVVVDWWRQKKQQIQSLQRFILPTVAVLITFALIEFMKFEFEFVEYAQYQKLKRAWIYLAMPVCFSTMFLVNIELVLKLLTPSAPVENEFREDV